MIYAARPELRPTSEEEAAEERKRVKARTKYREQQAHKKRRDLSWRRPVYQQPRVPMRFSRGGPLPAFATFVADYCEGRRPDPATAWVRTGDPNKFSEFTHRLHHGFAQMTPGRGSGTLTGQYSLGPWSRRHQWDPYAKERVQREGPKSFGLVPAPRNPYIVRGDPRDFDNAVRHIFRVAANSRNPAKDLDPFKAAKIVRFRGLSATDYPRVLSAIKDWRRTQMVHPVNILLARMGHDGLTYADPRAASSFATGSVRFPPINRYGMLVGDPLVSSRSVFPSCPPLPFTPIPAWK